MSYTPTEVDWNLVLRGSYFKYGKNVLYFRKAVRSKLGNILIRVSNSKGTNRSILVTPKTESKIQSPKVGYFNYGSGCHFLFRLNSKSRLVGLTREAFAIEPYSTMGFTLAEAVFNRKYYEVQELKYLISEGIVSRGAISESLAFDSQNVLYKETSIAVFDDKFNILNYHPLFENDILSIFRYAKS